MTYQVRTKCVDGALRPLIYYSYTQRTDVAEGSGVARIGGHKHRARAGIDTGGWIMRQHLHRNSTLVISCVAMLALAGTAMGQNALGDVASWTTT